jgi:FKBP-type peptidyl-prolyl cis-trans isomerase
MLPEDEAVRPWKKQPSASALQLKKTLYNYNKSAMKQINFSLSALFGILLLVSCDNHGLNKTKSGLLYKIISDGKNPVVKRGQFIKLTFSQKISGTKDSVLFTSDSSLPAYVPIDSVPPNSYSPVEIFSLLRKGDSAVVIQLADSIQKKSGNQPLPPFIHKKDKIILTLRIQDVFDSEELVKKDRDSLLVGFHAKQSQQVENYLKEHNIQATKTAKGTFVEIKTPGDGPVIDSGKQVAVIYTGKLFPSGKVFETNDKENGQPIKFVVGKHQIIQGWEDGVRLLKKGSSATLYIPAFLAYDQQIGPGKKQFENLIFDIKIVDVTDAPAESQMPKMPGGQNRPNMHAAPAPVQKK